MFSDLIFNNGGKFFLQLFSAHPIALDFRASALFDKNVTQGIRPAG
jgi:hypothetical protein